MRFPEFTEEWETKKLEEICKMQAGKFISASEINDKKDTGLFPCYGGNGLRGYVNLFNRVGMYSLIGRQGALCGNVNLANGKFYATEHAVVAASFENIDTIWMFYLLNFLNLNQYSTGMAQPGLSIQNLEKIETKIPNNIIEQKKIGSLLSVIDERISTQNKIIEELKLLKITLRYQLYEQILNQENEYVQVKDTLNYEQPTKYLVTNTDYSSDISLIPVLTANKAFVLGYTNEEFGIYDKGQCIIFDDFTMDIKFVNFPFKVKSSAIKILTAKPNVNLKFIFEYLSFLNLSSNEHKRHYISEIEPLKMQLPNYIQQTYVAGLLASIDDKIKTEFEIHTLLIKQKKYLLANLFI